MQVQTCPNTVRPSNGIETVVLVDCGLYTCYHDLHDYGFSHCYHGYHCTATTTEYCHHHHDHSDWDLDEN